MVVVQRVVSRWSAAGRGADAAAGRRAKVPEAVPLPKVSNVELAVHDLLATESSGYQLSSRLLLDGTAAAAVSLDLNLRDDGALAVRRQPFWVAYPRGLAERGRHLFVLAPGQSGRCRLNFRTLGSQCPCSPVWYYEQWIIHVANAPADSDLFVTTTPTYDIDERVHLYGGATTVRGRR